jgi:PGAP1-like protein/WD40-like Beta Propeller Repeat
MNETRTGLSSVGSRSGTSFDFRISGSAGLVALAVALWTLAFPSICSAQAPTSARPIIFLPGFCGSWQTPSATDDFTGVRNYISAAIKSQFPEYANTTNMILYYDPAETNPAFRVKAFYDRSPLIFEPGAEDLRFFSVAYYKASLQSFLHADVATVSIVNKAFELAEIIKAITAITHVRDVILVGHSMGGLVGRAYLEGLMAPASTPCNLNYNNCTIMPGFRNDVSGLITLDTPHGGCSLSQWWNVSLGNCFTDASTNKMEMAPLSTFILCLNYQPGILLGTAGAYDIPGGATVSSIESFDSANPFVINGLTHWWDGVVDSIEQDVRYYVPAAHRNNQYLSAGNPEQNYGCLLQLPPGTLHILGCVGGITETQQVVRQSIELTRGTGTYIGDLTAISILATLYDPSNGTVSPWVGPIVFQVSGPAASQFNSLGYVMNPGFAGGSWPLGSYSVSLVSGGPPGATLTGIAPLATQSIGQGSWQIDFHLEFALPTAGPPPAPGLLSPGGSSAPGPSIASLTPTFQWQAVNGADGYEFDLSDSSGVIFTTQALGGSQVSFVYPTPLVDNHAYWWQMSSHNSVGWGTASAPFYFYTFTGQASGDFSISATPPNQSVPAGGTTAFVVSTTTTQGAAQMLYLSVGSVPAGVSATLGSSFFNSGGQTALTVVVGAGTTPGSYSIPISATSDIGITHSTTIGLTVNTPPGGGDSAVCLTPSSLSFADQMVGTSSPTQTVTLQNCGNASLHIAGIGASADFFIGPGSIAPPLDLIAGGSTTFQAGFSPWSPGARSGTVSINTNAAGSPQTLPLNGYATPGTVTTGDVMVQVTINGLPYIGSSLSFSLTGPGGTMAFGSVPLTYPSQAPGSWTAAMIWAPSNWTFVSITPSATQTLSAGGTILFTFNYTATNNFSISCSPISVVVPAGGSGILPILAWGNGGQQTWTLAVLGVPAGTVVSFSPQPIPLGMTGTSTATITTSPSTPPGIYSLEFSATNQDGTTRFLNEDIYTGFHQPFPLVVVTSSSPQFVSIGPGGVLSDGMSDFPSISSDGRYVAFFSAATDLVPGDTNGQNDVFVRDLSAGTTVRASLASDGSQSNGWSGQPSISADGMSVAFMSGATNLVAGGGSIFGDIYVRNMQAGTTVLASLAYDGTVPNSASLNPSISGDGRYVAFETSATNMVAGGGGGVSQVYVRDLLTGDTSVVSVANDGSLGNGDSSSPTLSGDGRYVSFFSMASNFVPGATSAGSQVFLYDRQTRMVELESGPPDGSAPNGQALGMWGSDRSSLSPDGRYISFTSYASNLVAGDDDFLGDVFVRDRATGTTTLASKSNDGTLVGGFNSAISADGRYVSFGGLGGFRGFPLASQIAVRDLTTMRTVVYSVGPGDALASAWSGTTALSSDGRVLAFSSDASNLVAGDTNGQRDVFSVSLPADGPVYAQALSIAPASAPGGSTLTGTISLNVAAPVGGATVQLTSSALEAQVPAVVTVPAGSASALFSIATLPVSGSTPVAVTASYGGGSPWAGFTLTRAVPASIQVLDGDGQAVAVGAPLPAALRARVFDGANNPLSGASVQFIAPASGPSGIFPGGGTTALVATDAGGIATAPVFYANNSTGLYPVIASASGVSSPAVFGVTNTAVRFYTMAPCRLIDTRRPSGTYGGPALQGGGAQRSFPINGQCGVPADAIAVSTNITVVGPTGPGDLRLFPTGTPTPSASAINFSTGRNRANNAIVPLTSTPLGGLTVQCDINGGTTNFIFDVNGYFR